MNKRQKEVIQIHLDNEKAVIQEIKKAFEQAKKDCEDKIAQLNARKDMQNLKSIIYQRRYQKALKKQIEEALDALQENEYESIKKYLNECYEDGFIGNLYDLQGQKVPLTFPIDQKQVAEAVQIDAKLSNGLYTKLGENIRKLKKSIQAELSRGIANGSSWVQIASKIAEGMNSPFNKAMNRSILIARTEGHRIQNQAALDCQRKAKERGADIVKKWDATLDGRTRPWHVEVDGQIRELDKKFFVGGEEMDAPGNGGSAKNVCNCRCALLQIARWALDIKTTKRIGDTDMMSDEDLTPIAERLSISVQELRKYKNNIIPMSAKSYNDFREQYEKIWNHEKTKVKHTE